MKRFYTVAAVQECSDGYQATLDGRIVKTPGKEALVMPTKALADAVVREWQEQGDEIDASVMHMTRLANTCLDRVVPRRDEVISEICAFAETDLVCYRAEEPDKLVTRQAKEWDPYLAWLGERYNARLKVGSGIMPLTQEAETLKIMQDIVAEQDSFALTALHGLTNGLGSLVLALAHVTGEHTLDAVWQASQLDEMFQAEEWGTDAEMQAKQANIYRDIEAASRFLSLL